MTAAIKNLSTYFPKGTKEHYTAFEELDFTKPDGTKTKVVMYKSLRTGKMEVKELDDFLATFERWQPAKNVGGKALNQLPTDVRTVIDAAQNLIDSSILVRSQKEPHSYYVHTQEWQTLRNALQRVKNG